MHLKTRWARSRDGIHVSRADRALHGTAGGYRLIVKMSGDDGGRGASGAQMHVPA